MTFGLFVAHSSSFLAAPQVPHDVVLEVQLRLHMQSRKAFTPPSWSGIRRSSAVCG